MHLWSWKKRYWAFGFLSVIWTSYLLIDQNVVLTLTAEDFDDGTNSTWLQVNTTSTGPPSWQQLFINRQEEIYRQRNQRVNDVCQYLDNSITGSLTQQSPPKNRDERSKKMVKMSHFSVSSTYQTMGCFLNKVASSSLVSAFLLANGHGNGPWTSPHSLSSYLNPRSLEEFQYANNTFFKFMFVRHPMERMLSCYLDKMVTSPHSSLPAFRRFVKQKGAKLVKKHKRKNDRNNKNNRMLATKEQPTFEEFLEFVLSTDLQGVGYDSHWVPFFRYCNPCRIRYDVIGKLETAADDFRYVWDRTGLSSKVSIPWVNRATPPPTKTEVKVKQSKHRYYASLPRELIVRFFHTFRPDFDLFDYSIDEVLLMAGHPPLQDTEL